MAYPTLDTVNTSKGAYTLLVYVGELVPLFWPLTLFAIFVVTLLGGYFFMVNNNGRGDFPANFAAAGIITAAIALIMSAIPIINLTTLVFTFAIAIVGVIWLMLSR